MSQVRATMSSVNWRPIAAALTLSGIPMLVVGNTTFPVADGFDLTPFELVGPPFFLVVVPTFVVCAVRRQWGVAAVTAAIFHLVTTCLCWALLTRAVALSWLSMVLLVGGAWLAPQLVNQRSQRRLVS
jgi:hypothetical protein